MELFFVLQGTGNRSSPAGLQPSVTEITDIDIVSAAMQMSTGHEPDAGNRASPDRMATTTDDYASYLTRDERLRSSIAKLNGDGRLFEVFPMTVAGAADFLFAADKYQMFEEAKILVVHRALSESSGATLFRGVGSPPTRNAGPTRRG